MTIAPNPAQEISMVQWPVYNYHGSMVVDTQGMRVSMQKKRSNRLTSAVVREKVFIIRVRGGRELWGEQVSFAPGPQPM